MVKLFTQKQHTIMEKNLKEKLHNAVNHLSHVFAGRADLTDDVISEVTDLFELDSKEERLKAYKDFQECYETLIFHAWDKPVIGDKAFAFFDEILSAPETTFSCASVLRLMDCPDENLLKLVKNHRQKFLSFNMVAFLRASITRIRITGPWPSWRPWKDKEKAILAQIERLLQE